MLEKEQWESPSKEPNQSQIFSRSLKIGLVFNKIRVAMKKVEIVGRIPMVPSPLIEAVQDADPNFAQQFGEKCVANKCLEKEELDLIVGVACLAKAYELSEKIKDLLKNNIAPSEQLILKARNLYWWGWTTLQNVLPELNKE